MRIIRFCVAFALLCAALPAAAQEKYPNRPVKFVVSFAAGGSNDIIARVLCDWLSDHFGQQFVVENRPGGSGNVGAASVISAAPDGYTLMFVGPNNATISSPKSRATQNATQWQVRCGCDGVSAHEFSGGVGKTREPGWSIGGGLQLQEHKPATYLTFLPRG